MLKKYRKILDNAPDDKSFNSSQGEIRNLGELRNLLLDKGKFFWDQYTQGENHFANWVEHVFNDEELAQSLRKANSYVEAARMIDNRINYAELWLNYNSDLEILSEYLLQDYKELYEPKHHEFETLRNSTLPSPSKPSKPKPEIPKPRLEAPKFSDEDKRDDHKLLQQLESQYGIKTNKAPEPKEKSFMKKFNPLQLFRK